MDGLQSPPPSRAGCLGHSGEDGRHLVPRDREGPLFACCEKMCQAGPGGGVGVSPPHRQPLQSPPSDPRGPLPESRLSLGADARVCGVLPGVRRAHILWRAPAGPARFTPPAAAATRRLTWASLPFLRSGRRAGMSSGPGALGDFVEPDLTPLRVRDRKAGAAGGPCKTGVCRSRPWAWPWGAGPFSGWEGRAWRTPGACPP